MIKKRNYLFALFAVTFGMFNADLVAQDEAANNV